MAVWVIVRLNKKGKNGKKYNKFGGLTRYV